MNKLELIEKKIKSNELVLKGMELYEDCYKSLYMNLSNKKEEKNKNDTKQENKEKEAHNKKPKKHIKHKKGKNEQKEKEKKDVIEMGNPNLRLWRMIYKVIETLKNYIYTTQRKIMINNLNKGYLEKPRNDQIDIHDIFNKVKHMMKEKEQIYQNILLIEIKKKNHLEKKVWIQLIEYLLHYL